MSGFGLRLLVSRGFFDAKAPMKPGGYVRIWLEGLGKVGLFGCQSVFCCCPRGGGGQAGKNIV